VTKIDLNINKENVSLYLT